MSASFRSSGGALAYDGALAALGMMKVMRGHVSPVFGRSSSKEPIWAVVEDAVAVEEVRIAAAEA